MVTPVTVGRADVFPRGGQDQLSVSINPGEVTGASLQKDGSVFNGSGFISSIIVSGYAKNDGTDIAAASRDVATFIGTMLIDGVAIGNLGTLELSQLDGDENGNVKDSIVVPVNKYFSTSVQPRLTAIKGDHSVIGGSLRVNVLTD